MQVLNPDKARFCDLEAESSDKPIHTVEISDSRSVRQFITLWFKGKDKGSAWAEANGNAGLHDPEVYHREKTEPDFQPFISRLWPGKESEGWSNHYHIDLNRPPQLSDFDSLTSIIPDSILTELTDHLRERN